MTSALPYGHNVSEEFIQPAHEAHLGHFVMEGLVPLRVSPFLHADITRIQRRGKQNTGRCLGVSFVLSVYTPILALRQSWRSLAVQWTDSQRVRTKPGDLAGRTNSDISPSKQNTYT